MIVTRMLSGALCAQEASLALSISRVGEAADLMATSFAKSPCPSDRTCYIWDSYEHTSAYACIHSAPTTSGLVGLGVLYRITCICTLHSSLKITLTLSTPRRPASLHYNDIQSHVITLLALLNKIFLARQGEFDPSCTLVMGECRLFRVASTPVLSED
jgi:hypothetical protein